MSSDRMTSIIYLYQIIEQKSVDNTKGAIRSRQSKKARHYNGQKKLEWAEPVSLTFHSALKKLNTEP